MSYNLVQIIEPHFGICPEKIVPERMHQVVSLIIRLLSSEISHELLRHLLNVIFCDCFVLGFCVKLKVRR